MKGAGVIFACLVGITTAGFCDEAFFKYSGYRCDGEDYSKYCACKSKKKSGTKCDKTSETRCSYGCSGGRCSPPPTPKPADEACAKRGIDDQKVLAVCPNVAEPYRTWQDKQENTQWLDAVIPSVAEDIAWWKVNLIPYMLDLADEDVDLVNFTQVAMYAPEMAQAWTAVCEADAETYSCQRVIPECKSDSGYTSQCEKDCSKMDSCVAGVYSACIASKAKVNSSISNCSMYKQLFPEYVDKATGLRDCVSLCDEFQNDRLVNAASTAVLSVSAIVVGLASMLLQ